MKALQMAAATLAISGVIVFAPVHAQTPAGGHGAGSAPSERAPAVQRPPLFFREEWKQDATGGAHATTDASVANPDLQLVPILPDGMLELAGAAGNENNPVHVFTGTCTTPCGLALSNKKSYVDLTGLARIRLNTKMSGYHQVRPLIKLPDGTLLVGDQAQGLPGDWLVSEIQFANLRWLKLDPKRVVTQGIFVDHVDLTKVDAVGWIDLIPGSGHGFGGWADVGEIEVYGKAVPR